MFLTQTCPDSVCRVPLLSGHRLIRNERCLYERLDTIQSWTCPIAYLALRRNATLKRQTDLPAVHSELAGHTRHSANSEFIFAA